ncbi:MAG: hypothetical protein Athens101410_321 [Parcubacteria group bacterium Athens1014_10]|nr:MAG: hypothetical protein Athens101410_321 [Parcubacteria group bacterium Athens1014_10]TSD05961.1 MAG: hypothetical protein Athens071412_108 [Parcubacteria group bacterium Athens0714_12]
MKNKILIIAVILIVLAAGIGIGIYFSKNNEITGAEQEIVKSGEESQPNQNNILATADFSLNKPAGWREVPAPTGVSAMVVNADEEIIDEAVKKINFKSYLSIGYDTFNGRSEEEYVKYIKDSLVQAVPGIIFTDEKSNVIGDKNFYFIESEVNQKGADFKVLIVLIKGKNNDVWTISFNTTKNYWPNYKDLFYQTAQSFKLK